MICGSCKRRLNQTAAIRANNVPHLRNRLVLNHCNHSHAVQTGNRSVRLFRIRFVLLLNRLVPNRDRYQSSHGTGNDSPMQRKRSHDPKQRLHAGSLLIKGIGIDAGRHLIAGEHTAHCDCLDAGKPISNQAQQLEAGHARHIQIGEKNVGGILANLSQRRETVLSCPHLVSDLSKQDVNDLPNRIVIVRD